MAGTYLKMFIDIKLIGDYTATFQLLHLDSSVHEWISPILFISDDNFVIEKSAELKYTPSRLILPYKVKPNQCYMTMYQFSSDTERYNRLKKLHRNLLLFSKSNVFKKINSSTTIYELNMADEHWYLY